MAAADPQALNGSAVFDHNRALKNYAAGMAMSGLYWPSAASFDSNASSAVYAAAAYSQASALAAAAAASNMQSLNCSPAPPVVVNGSNGSGGGGGLSVPPLNGMLVGGGTSQASVPAIRSPYTPTSPPQIAADQINQVTLAGGTSVCHAVHSTSSTPKKKSEPVPEHLKDNTYWERRKRNNESARRSREARRMKEEQIAFRVVYLEQENLQLRTEVSMLRSEIEKLRMILYNTHH